VSSGVDEAPADAAEVRRVSGSCSHTYRILEFVLDSILRTDDSILDPCYEMWEELHY
jgi:hypothetical protein